MGRYLPTLYRLCLQATAEQLKNSYWNTDHNPFKYFPSDVVDALIVYVCRASTSVPLKSSDLQLLVESGRTREFAVEDIKNFIRDERIIVSAEDLVSIFMNLSCFAEELTSLRISLHDKKLLRNLRKVTPALNCLLEKARNVKHVESNVDFDLSILCKCSQLESLFVRFVPDDHLYDFLIVDGRFRHHTSLKSVHFSESSRQSYDSELAVVLKYCTELTYVHNDITRALLTLHFDEWFNNCLAHVYKLRKCYLRKIPRGSKQSLDLNAIFLLASQACPHLEDLKVKLLHDDKISNLICFRNLKTLRLLWLPWDSYLDYTKELQSVLEKPEFGHQLTTLELTGMENVDFSSIGRCCPNLETLHITFDFAKNRSEISPTSFKRLRSLYLRDSHGNDVGESEKSCAELLSAATNVEHLDITSVSLTDRVLEAIFKKNGLSKMRRFVGISDGICNRLKQFASRSPPFKIIKR